MRALHRTTTAAAKSILNKGFNLAYFGIGAGAGSGEPAGIFLSPGDGADFQNECQKRNLGFDAILQVEFTPVNLHSWQRDIRIDSFKEARLNFLMTRFSISDDDARAIASYKMRILRERKDLSDIADFLSTREGEKDLARHFSAVLLNSGIDAVTYKDPWQNVDQIIILDPSVITAVRNY